MFHGEYSLNAKAWNGRVICAWLSEVMALAARGYPAGHDEGRVALVAHCLNLCQVNVWPFSWVGPELPKFRAAHDLKKYILMMKPPCLGNQSTLFFIFFPG